VNGQMNDSGTLVPFDRVQLSFDMNTIPENTDYRFETEHIFEFYKAASNLHDQLYKEFEAFIK
jgi:hypothetical protein